MNTESILPCPHCGIIPVVTSYFYHTCFYALLHCQNGCRLYSLYSAHGDEKFVTEYVITKWNRKTREEIEDQGGDLVDYDDAQEEHIAFAKRCLDAYRAELKSGIDLSNEEVVNYVIDCDSEGV